MLVWLGENDEAVRCAERAYAGFRKAGDPMQAAMAAVGLFFLHRVSLGNEATASGWLGRLARLVEENELAPLEGWVLLLRSVDHDDLAEAERCARRAGELARAFGDADLELSALSQIGAILVAMGRVDEGVALLDEAVTGSLAGEGTNLGTVVLTSCNMVNYCSRAARFERATEWVRVSDDFTRRYGSPHLHTLCRLSYGRVLAATGRWAEAEKELETAVRGSRTGERGLHADALAALAELRLWQGRPEEAERLVERFEEHAATAPVLAAVRLLRGDAASAGALLRRRLRVLGEETLESAALLELLCEVEIAEGAAAEAAERAGRLAALGDALGCEVIVARGERALGRALAGDPHAVSHLERALDAFARLGMPLETGRTRLLLAQALDGGEREAEARAALTAFEELGAARDADAAAGLLRSMGVRVGRGGPQGAGALTKREQEVLALLAEGLTNREMAERLFLAPKTVEHHVRSVLSKLGLRGRAEAAAYAVRHAGSAAK